MLSEHLLNLHLTIISNIYVSTIYLSVSAWTHHVFTDLQICLALKNLKGGQRRIPGYPIPFIKPSYVFRLTISIENVMELSR